MALDLSPPEMQSQPLLYGVWRVTQYVKYKATVTKYISFIYIYLFYYLFNVAAHHEIILSDTFSHQTQCLTLFSSQ